MLLIFTCCVILVLICRLFSFILGGCKFASKGVDAEAENRRRAEEVIAEKKASGREGNVSKN